MGNNTIDMDSDQFKVALMDSNHSFVSTDTDFSQVSTNEITAGNGYSSGGKLLSNTSWTESSGVVTFDADDVVWTASGGSIGPASHAVIYDDTATDDKLVASITFDSAETAGDGTDFKLAFNSSGILRIT